MSGEKQMSDVLNKIRAETPKKQGPLARTRTRATVVNPERTEKLSDLLAPHLPAAVQAWVDGLKANKIAWNPNTHAWEEINLPDHEVRRRNALHIIEFVEGKPIERSMEVSGNYKELSQVLEELKQSPEARPLLPPEIWGMMADSSQSTAESAESERPHDGETKSDSQQKTG
jgi:hypothetical protein